jgi:hypothetical protein
LSTFLQLSSRKPTELPILFCLKEWNKTAFDVWFYVLMTTTSKTMVFFDHQNKCLPALRVDVSCLCNGDSNLDHVQILSPAVPRLGRRHQNTITSHSHQKRGDVVWRLGVWGNGIWMHPKNWKISGCWHDRQTWCAGPVVIHLLHALNVEGMWMHTSSAFYAVT